MTTSEATISDASLIQQSIPRASAAAALEQAAFRTLLQAMSHPGTLYSLSEPRTEDNEWGAALVVLQALVDHEVTFHVAADDGYPHEQLLRRTGARSAPLDQANFVLTDAAHALTAIEAALEGPFEEPERSATVVVVCDALGFGPTVVELTGPGVDGERRFAVDGLGDDFFPALARRNAVFPSGIDVVLVDHGQQVACVPRSTRMRAG